MKRKILGLHHLQKSSVITFVLLTTLITIIGIIPVSAQTNPAGAPITTNELKSGDSNGACKSIGGTWNSSTCTLNTNLILNPYDYLIIDPSMTLIVTGTIINAGTVTNNGTIINNGNITNTNGGAINNGGTITNSDYINNGGTIINYDGTITNSGTINNISVIYNSGGIINNSGMFNGKSVVNTGTISSGYPINTKCEYMIWIIGQNSPSIFDWMSKKVVEKGLGERINILYRNQSEELTSFYLNLYQNYGAGACNSQYAPVGCEQQLNSLINKQKKEIETFLINPTLLQEIRKISTPEDFAKFGKGGILNQTECLSIWTMLHSTSTSTSNPSNTTSTTSIPSSKTQSASVFTPTSQDIQKINQARANQTIAAEVNIRSNQSTTTSIDNNVSVQTTSTTPDSLNVNVSASSQTGPKVIVFNLNAAIINVTNLKDLGVMYDGKLISPAPDMDAILHAKPTDSPSFVIVVTQSGIQVLVLVPHFSTHSITITNMSKVIQIVPEFSSITTLVLAIAIISTITVSKTDLRFLSKF